MVLMFMPCIRSITTWNNYLLTLQAVTNEFCNIDHGRNL